MPCQEVPQPHRQLHHALQCALQGAREQLQRVELLAKLGQYDEARLQLRRGSFASLRLDLGYGSEAYRVIRDSVRRVGQGGQPGNVCLGGDTDVKGRRLLHAFFLQLPVPMQRAACSAARP